MNGRRRFKRRVAFAIVIVVVLCGGALAFASKHLRGEQSPQASAQALSGADGDPPRCVPKQLDVSSVLPHTDLSVSPLPGSYEAMPQTQISLLGAPARQISDLHVSGSLTGAHDGKLIAYSQGDGASFVPEQPFRSGELVKVTGELRLQSASKPFAFHFTVAYPDPMPPQTAHPPAPPQGEAGTVLHFHSAPDLEPPAVKVTRSSQAAAEGDIFLAPYKGPGKEGPMIVTASGELVWMNPLPLKDKATNFQVERYNGKPVLTWWQGYIPPQGFGLGEEIVTNTEYKPILHVKAGNGDMADLHDFHIEPHHTAVLTVFKTIHCDLSEYGGPKTGALTDALYQEIDIKTGLVRREWDSVDHVSLALSYSEDKNASSGWPFDYFHINTIDPRGDGTTLISSRNTAALYIVDDKTGKVLEKIGGKQSSVKMGPGAATGFQHDSMTLPNGDISVFDNGGTPFVGEKGQVDVSHAASRGIVTQLDAEAGTDSLLFTLQRPTPLKAGSQGDVQLLGNGDWFVGWGQEPYFSEFNPAGEMIYEGQLPLAAKAHTKLNAKGEVVYDAHLPETAQAYKSDESYRTYKFEWNARPSWPPAIAASKASDAGKMEVWASWNGATEVASWRILGGSSQSTLKPLLTGEKRGFETAFKTTYQPYVAVQALNAAGEVIGNSKTVEPAA